MNGSETQTSVVGTPDLASRPTSKSTDSAGWTVKTLGEVCEITDGTHFSPKNSEVGEYKYITAKNIKPYSIDLKKITYVSRKSHEEIYSRCPVKKGDVLYIKDGATAGAAALNTLDEEFSLLSSVALIKCSDEILNSFLVHYMNSEIGRKNFLGYIGGAAITRLTLVKLNNVTVPIPPLAEQKRIVAVLDEAFAAIAKVKENAEKNLRNAKELFESYLQGVFTNPSEGWQETTLGEVCTDVQYGTSAKSKASGKVAVLRMGNIQDSRFDWENLVYTSDKAEIAKYSLKYNDVLFNRTNSPELVGKSAIYKGEQPAIFAGYLIRIIRKESLIDADFLNYYLNSRVTREYGFSVMTSSVNQANINGSKLKEYPIYLPPIAEQKVIVSKFNALSAETNKLEAIYQRKLAHLEELKKSLLQKAFRGALSKDFGESNVLPFPVSIPNISVTDLHAGILAITYKAHESKGTQRTFGHVKAEKIAHMVENWVGIDLGRTPVKDAAGPNDFRHLRTIESRAEKASFFYFRKTSESSYQFTPGRQIESVIQRTKRALGEKSATLDKLLEIMVKMDTRQAEIFATVYAAWNNLLLAGNPITDEDIVFEARENWHQEKLKIPRERFFEAIKWMKDKDIVPMGKGKMVQSKKAV